MARALWRMLEAQAVLDGGESSQEFTVGVRRDKACPPLVSPPLPSPCQKRGRRRASPCRRGTRRIVPISLPLYRAQSVSSQTFLLRIPHAIWALFARARWRKLCDFLISQRARFDKFLSFTPLLPSPTSPLYRHRLISRHQDPVVMAKTSFESSVLCRCLSSSSCQPHQRETRSAPDGVKLKRTLHTIYR